MENILIILFAIGASFILLGCFCDEETPVVLGIIICVISGFLLLIYPEEEVKKEYKFDLPEEFILAKPGDTLIINKIKDDSIYLEFKPKQLSKKEKLITIQKQIDSLSVELNNMK